MLATSANGVLDSEVGLVLDSQREDQDRYERFVRAHARPTLAVARRYLGREEDAWDAVKDAFRRAELDPSCHRRENPSSALQTLVFNSAISLLRANFDEDEDAIEDSLPRFLEDGRFADKPQPWKNAGLVLRSPALGRHVRECLDKLPDRYRVVLVLHDSDGRSMISVATLLGLSVSETTARLHCARQALRTLIDRTMRT